MVNIFTHILFKVDNGSSENQIEADAYFPAHPVAYIDQEVLSSSVKLPKMDDMNITTQENIAYECCPIRTSHEEDRSQLQAENATSINVAYHTNMFSYQLPTMNNLQSTMDYDNDEIYEYIRQH